MSEEATASQAPTTGADVEKATKQPRRINGVGFPAMPLGEAVSMIKKVASYGTQHTDAAVASFLGHSTANSGPFRSKVAALRDYGFLTGKSGELTVTPLALEIVHPGLGADPEASLRGAFLHCKVFAAVYEALPKGQELDVTSLANTAMHNHGVSARAKDAFAQSFVKGAELAGLMEEIDAEHVRIPDDEDTSEPQVNDEDVAPSDAGRGAGAPTPRPAAAASSSANAVVSHSWPIEGGTIRFTIESANTLPAGAYGVIGSVIEAGDKLALMLAPKPDQRPDETPGASADSE